MGCRFLNAGEGAGASQYACPPEPITGRARMAHGDAVDRSIA